MNHRRNQTIAIALFLLYKAQLNERLDGMSDEYMEHPIGVEVGEYIENLMKYCPEETVDKVLHNQQGLITRLGVSYLSILASMQYEKGEKPCTTDDRMQTSGEIS